MTDSWDTDTANGWCGAVGEYFMERTGKIALSPNDDSVICRWEAARMPLDVAKAGIDTCVGFLRDRGQQRLWRLPVAYCDHAVRREFEGYCRRLGLRMPDSA